MIESETTESELSQRNSRIPFLTYRLIQYRLSRSNGLKGCLQSGQAALEAMISALALAVLWVGIAWLGRIQDIALQASHAARYSAFMASRDHTTAPVTQVRTAFFTGVGNQWSDRRGGSLQASVYQAINVSRARGKPVAFDAQVGGSDPDSIQLREDWELDDPGVLSVHVSLAPRTASELFVGNKPLLQLEYFDAAYPTITRSVAILTGAGHAGSDILTAERIARSDLGWSGPTDSSVSAGRRVASVASKVDAAWGRPKPVFDWLGPWAGHVPEQHLRELP